jgi:hypothetical protein
MRHVKSGLLAGALALLVGAAEGWAQGKDGIGTGEEINPRYSERVIESGDLWELKTVVGSDDRGRGYERQVYHIVGAKGVYNAPLRDLEVQEELAASADTRDAVFIVDKQIVDEIALSKEQGRLTPYLESIVEPLDEGELPPRLAGQADQRIMSCADQVINRTASFALNSPLNQNFNLGGGFTGSLTTNGGLTGSATGEVQIILKRTRVLWWCVPHSVKFDRARAYGNAQVNYGATVNGTVNYSYNWSTQIAKPHLFSLNFFIGPIPVHIGFNLPITMGLEINASVTGQVTYTGSQQASGSFDYTCRLSGCTGWSNYSLTNPSGSQPVTAGISGRIQPTVWVQAAVRAYLYTEWVAYAQVGVRPYLYGDLWGYYGNACGDADGDGQFETVSALTFNLDWRLFLTAEARAFGASPTQWNNLWSTPRRHIRFWDLIGSSAIRPILAGPGNVAVFNTNAYSVRMRPCWPYGDTVNYQVNWGDSTSSSASGAPQTATPLSKSWSTAGARTVSAIALSDSWGRNLGSATTTRTVNVNPASTWTAWLNRDSPSGNGDYETLADFRAAGNNICNGAAPIGIECRTLGGVNWSSTGEVYSCTASTGGVCVNAQQPDGYCQDYEVRFLCP